MHDHIDNKITLIDDEVHKLFSIGVPDLLASPSSDIHFHYTTMDVFEKIIKTSRIRFSHFRSLNDPNEVKYAIQHIKNIGHLHSSCNVTRFLDEIFLKFEELLANYGYFTFSGSLEGHNLNLFKRYPIESSSHNDRIAIGFHIYSMLQKDTIAPTIGKVSYGKFAYRDILMQGFEQFFNMYNQFKCESREPEYIRSLEFRFIAFLFSYIPLIKEERNDALNIDWSIEKECRLFFNPFNAKRLTLSNEISFYCPIVHNAIHTVVLAPGFGQLARIEDVKLKNNLTFEILKC
jgi:hypothetical protein